MSWFQQKPGDDSWLRTCRVIANPAGCCTSRRCRQTGRSRRLPLSANCSDTPARSSGWLPTVAGPFRSASLDGHGDGRMHVVGRASACIAAIGGLTLAVNPGDAPGSTLNLPKSPMSATGLAGRSGVNARSQCAAAGNRWSRCKRGRCAFGGGRQGGGTES